MNFSTILCRAIPAAIFVPAALGLIACSSNGASPAASLLPSQQLSPVPTAASRLSQCPCIYVVNRVSPNGQSGTPSMTVYPVNAKKDAKPIESISGTATGLTAPWGVALDSSDNIYITSTLGQSINIYAAGANGNVAPTATIAGSNTRLDEPVAIALDSSNNVYVNNFSGSSVEVFSAGSTGNVSPMQFIAGSNTGLDAPEGIAIDAGDNIYVASSHANSINVYAAGATGNVSPIREIAGSSTGLNLPTGLALDANDNIYVANDTGNCTAQPCGNIEVFAAGATGNVAPMVTISGKKTKFDYPYGVALDASGKIHVADSVTDIAGAIATFTSSAHGDAKPSLLRGKKTGIAYPLGIFIR